MDDTIICPNGPEKLKNFFNPLNSVHQNTQLTMEMQRDSYLPFHDMHIYRRPDGYLGHKVHCKHTHTNLYLNSGSHHHFWCTRPGLFETMTAIPIKRSFWGTLLGRMVTVIGRFARLSTLCECYSTQGEQDSAAFLLHVRSDFNHISRVLS
jgi:hypothetical protein